MYASLLPKPEHVQSNDALRGGREDWETLPPSVVHSARRRLKRRATHLLAAASLPP
jgi:hypothetical protein